MTYNRSSPIPRMSEQVARQIADYISFEQLKPGTKLPTERMLSEVLEVSRSSVREGLRVMEIIGYVHSRQGYGTFVSEAAPFLLPQQVIHQKLSRNQLDHYFETAIMVAEKIIQLSFKQEDRPVLELGKSPIVSDQNINNWHAFSKWIIDLGNDLDNLHYKSLWETTYQFLCEHNYFE